MIKHPKTHEDMMLNLIESSTKLFDDIRDRQEFLKENHDTAPETKLHNTKKIMQMWFHNNGWLPL